MGVFFNFLTLLVSSNNEQTEGTEENIACKYVPVTHELELPIGGNK
jgi:hypothetical protein